MTLVIATSRSDVNIARLSNAPDETFATVAVIISLVKIKCTMAIVEIFRIFLIKAKWIGTLLCFQGMLAACPLQFVLRDPAIEKIE